MSELIEASIFLQLPILSAPIRTVARLNVIRELLMELVSLAWASGKNLI